MKVWINENYDVYVVNFMDKGSLLPSRNRQDSYFIANLISNEFLKKVNITKGSLRWSYFFFIFIGIFLKMLTIFFIPESLNTNISHQFFFY